MPPDYTATWARLMARFDRVREQRAEGKSEVSLSYPSAEILRDIFTLERQGALAGRMEQVKDLCRQHVLYFRKAAASAPDKYDGLWDLFMKLRTQSLSPLEDCSTICQAAVFQFGDFPMDDDERPYLKVRGWLGHFVEWAKWTNAPLPMILWSGIGVLAGATGYRYYVNWGNPIRTGTYILLFSGGRSVGKSEGIRAAREILARHNHILEPLPLVDGRVPHWGWIHTLASHNTDAHMIQALHALCDPPVHIYFPDNENDPDPNKRTYNHTRNAQATMIVDELVNLIGKESFNPLQKIGLLTELYETGSFHKGTKADGDQVIHRACLTVMAAAAPNWIQQTIPTVVQEGGFLDRCQIIHRSGSPRQFPKRGPRDPIVAHHLASILTHISSIRDQQEIGVSAEAEEWYNHWYKNQPEEAHGQTILSRIEAPHSANRAGNNLLRLAGILSINDLDGKYMIEVAHLEMASMLLSYEDYYFTLWRKDLSTNDEVRRLVVLLRTIANAGGKMGQADLFRELQGSPHFKSQDRSSMVKSIDMAIRLAQTAEYISFNRQVDGKRARVTFHLEKLGYERLKADSITWKHPTKGNGSGEMAGVLEPEDDAGNDGGAVDPHLGSRQNGSKGPQNGAEPVVGEAKAAPGTSGDPD